jgi:hypothetical protein
MEQFLSHDFDIKINITHLMLKIPELRKICEEVEAQTVFTVRLC